MEGYGDFWTAMFDPEDLGDLEEYRPMEDRNLLLEYARLGEYVWTHGLTVSEGLVEKTKKFLKTYGPPEGHWEGVTDAIAVGYNMWLDAREVSLAYDCHLSLGSGGSGGLRETIVSRAGQIQTGQGAWVFYEPGPDWIKPAVADSERSDRRWMEKAAKHVQKVVNARFRTTGVTPNLEYVGENNAWKTSMQPDRLSGAIWLQLADEMARNEMKKCDFVRCKREKYFFKASNPQRFCDGLCASAFNSAESRKTKKAKEKAGKGNG